MEKYGKSEKVRKSREAYEQIWKKEKYEKYGKSEKVRKSLKKSMKIIWNTNENHMDVGISYYVHKYFILCS